MRHWTEEERARQSELIQSWRPWDKSTGARTSEGKVASSKNAFKGGIGALLHEAKALLKQHEELMKQFV